MGNQQCIGCKKDVPKRVKWFDVGEFDWGRKFYKWCTGIQWIKTSDGYICADCFKKRQAAEKERERARQKEIQKKEQEEQRRLQEKKRHQEEIAEREKEARRKQELEAERRRQYELARVEREREAKKKQEMEEEKRREEERARIEREARRKQEVEAERRRQEIAQGERRKQQQLEANRCCQEERARIIREKVVRMKQEMEEKKRRHEERAKSRREARIKQELKAERCRQERVREERRNQRLEAESRRQEERAREEREKTRREQIVKEEYQRLKKYDNKTNVEHNTYISKSKSNVKASFLNYLTGRDRTNLSLNCEEKDSDFSVRFNNSCLQQPIFEFERTGNFPTAIPSDSQTLSSEKTQSKVKCKCGNDGECKENDEILEEIRFQKALDDNLLETAKFLLSKYSQRIKNYELVYKRPWSFFENEKMMNVLKRKDVIQCISDDEIALCICEICFAVKKSKKFWPRNTQVISLLILIKSFFQGKLLEIKTGEGKTCTIAMFAAFLGLCGFSVDIVSSSPILARRDSQEWKNFYKLFSINVDCNLLPNDNNERIKCYAQQIVYGTVGSFASDILREQFLMEKVRGDRKLQVVIVDEVDCMLLDQGVNSTYLSNSIPGLHYLEPVILMIWAQVIRHPAIYSEEGKEYFCGILEPFFLPLCRLSSEKLLSDPFHILEILESNNLLNSGFTKLLQQEGLKSMEEFGLGNGNVQYKSLDSVLYYVNEDCIMACLEFMENIFDIQFEPYKIVDENTISRCKYDSQNKDSEILHLLLTNQGYVCQLYASRSKVIETIKQNVEEKFTSSENENSYELPNHLFSFVKNRLTTWIDNAFIAKCMSEGREYLVREREIVPVDYESTGVVELNTKWGDCLHQFLEIKHEKRISQLTIETNFMSNQTFFKLYRHQVFGVTGTLGTDLDINFLERTFGLTCVKIPTHCQSRFKEIEPLLCSTKEEWQSHIAQAVSYIVEMGRAALVICEDINTSMLLQANLKENVSKASVLLYARNDMNDEIPEKLKTADVIISTNIAGRGTDIEVDSDVKNAGGLFVLVTFFPSNERVENQIFGRSARKGLPGSAQLVINLENLPGYSWKPKVGIQILRGDRASFEQQRLQDLEQRDLSECLNKEELFACYCKILNESLVAVHDDKNMQIIYRNYLHEWWGIWLKKNFKTCDSCLLKKMLKQDFDEVCQKLLNDKKSPTENVAHFVKLANEYFTEGKYMTAKKLYSEAISMDKKCSSFAYYQRAYCTLKASKDSGYIDEAIGDLRHAQKYLARDKEAVMLSITLFNLCRDKKNDDELCETLNQFGIRCQLLHFIDENISGALKTLIEIKSQRKKAEAKGENIFTLALGEMEICKLVDTEVYLFWELGLTEIMNISEKAPFCWKGLVVSLIGVTEIAVGAFLLATSAGILANVGSGLIAEGVNDICTGSHAMLMRNNDFVKSWMIGKAISIATSVVTFGYSKIKTATSGVSGCKNTLITVKNEIKNGASKLLQNVKSIPKAVTSETFSITLRSTCMVVAKDVGMQLTKRGAKFLLDESKSKLKEHLDKLVRENIKQEVKTVFFEGNLKDILNDMIFHYYKNELNSSYSETCVEKKFENIIKSLLLSKDMPQVRLLLLGCLSGIGKYAEEKNPTMSELSVTDSIVDILKSLSSCTYDVRTLVKHYSEKLEEKINIEFKDCIMNYNKAISEESEQMKTSSVKYINKKKIILVEFATSHILQLLQETFDFTTSLKLAGKLQSVVGGVVSHYVSEHAVGKNMIQTILSLSSKTLMDTELVTQIENITEQLCSENAGKYLKLGVQTMKAAITIGNSTKIDQVFEHGLVLAENAANTFADEKTKVRIISLLKISKSCLNVSQQNGKASTLLKEGMDLIQNELENCCAGPNSKIFAFGIKTMKVALSISGKENVEETLAHGLQLAEDAVNTFTDEKTKTLTIFLLNIAKTSVKTFHSDSKPSRFLKLSLDILQGGLDIFETENSGKVIRFGVQTMEVALSYRSSKNAKKTLAHALQLIDDAADTFTHNKTKNLTKFLIQVVKDGVQTFSCSTLQSKSMKESLDILQEGLEFFCPNEAGKFLIFGVKTMKVALKNRKDIRIGQVLEDGIQLAEDAINTFTNDTTKSLSKHLVNIAKIGVRSLKSDEKPCELLKESLDILHGGLECVCPEDSKKFLTFGVKTMNMALSAGKSKSAEESLSYGLQLAEDAVSTFTNGKTKQLSTHLVNIAKVGVRSLKSNEKPSELLKESLDILHGGLECVCPEDSKKFLTFGVKTMNMALSAGKSKSAEESLSYGLQLAEGAVSTFTNGKTKQLSTHLVNIAKVGVRSLKSDEKPCELLKESLDILHGGLECVCPEDSKKFLTFGVKTMNMALSAGKSKSAEESLSYGLQLAEDAVSTFTNGKTKQLSTHLVNIAKVGVRSLKSDEKPCELLKESLDILHGGLECVCPEDSKKFLTFGVKTMNMALSAGKSKSAEESLSYGLQLAEDAVSTFTNGKTKQLSTHLVNIAKVGVRSLKSDEKPCELLKESLDILHGGLECVCPEDSKKFLTFGVKTMNMALSAGKSKSAEESLSYGLQLAEDAVSTFTNGKTKQLSTHLVNIAKVGVRSLKSDEKPCELLKESLDILHGGLECVCPEDSKKFLTFGVKTMNMALSAGKSKSAEESLSYGLKLAEDAVSTFTNGKTKQLSTHLVNIAKVGVRSLKSNEKPSELLKESLDILHGGLECVCPEDSKKFLTFGVKTMNMALSAGKSKSAEESLSYGLQLAEDAVSTFTNVKTKQLSTHLVNIAKVGVRSLKSNEKPSELLKESLDILHGGLECVCPEDSKKFLTFGVKTMNMALSAGKSKSAEESLSYGLQLAEGAVSTFTNGKTKQLSTHLVNIAKVGVRSLKSDEKPCELLKESLDILHGGLECVCPEDSKKFLTFGVKTMNMALSAGKSKSAEESLSYGLQLAEDAVSTFTNGKTKQLSTHLVNIAKVGVRSLKSDEKPCELLKESLDILHGGLECVCPEDSKKFLTFGVKTMNMALSAGKSKSAEESLSYGLQLAEDAVSTFTNGKTKQLSTHLLNIAKVGVRSLKSDEKPCELLKESLDILHGGLECVCPEDSKKFLTFGVKTMNMALSAGKSKSAEESLSYGLQLAEDAVSTFTNGKTKQLSTHLVNIAKVGVRSLKSDEKPCELLKESLDILHGGLECVCPEDSKKFLTFGVKTMNMALSAGKSKSAEESLSYGLQLAEDAVSTFTNGKTKQLSTHLVNIAKVGVRSLKSNEKPSELLKESLDILHGGLECVCPEDSKKFLTFGVKTMNMALSAGKSKSAEESLSYGLQLAEDAVSTFTNVKTKQLSTHLVNIAKVGVRSLKSNEKPSELLKESLDILHGGLECVCPEDSKKFLTFGVKTMNMALSAGKSKSAEESLSYGLQLAKGAVSTFTNGKTKQLSTHLVNIAKVGVRSLKSDEKPCELLKESLDILHGGLECVCPEDSKKFLTFGVKTMNMALSAGKSKSAEESLSYGLQLAEDAVSTFTNGKTKQLSTHLVNIAKVGVRSLKSDEKPCELLKESLDILHGGLECVCPEDSKKFLTFGVKTMNMALSAGKSKSAEESLSYGLQLAEDAVSTFTNGKTKQLSTHLVNIAKVGVRSLKSNEKPSELLKESLDILHGGLECVCPEDSKKFLTFGVKTMNMALSAGKSKSAEESLSYGLQLAEDAVSTFTNGKTKQLSTHLVNIAKVGVRSLKSNEKPSELLKESLDILHGGLECVCPEDSKKFLTFGVKTMNMALSAGKSKSAEESLSYGLQLAEDAVSTFTNGKTKQLSTHLVNIAKVGVRSLKSDEKPCELLKESLDILHGGLECVCPEDSKKFLTFGVKTMNMALSAGKSKSAEESLSYGLQLAEDAVSTFTNGETKQLSTHLVNIAKVGVRSLKSDEKPCELLKESLDILHGGLECVCPEDSKKFLTFGVKTMNMALSAGKSKSAEESLSYGLQLAEDAVSTFTNGKTKQLSTHLVNIAKVGVRSLKSDEKPCELLKESLDILHGGLECVCPEDSKKFLTFGVKTMNMALSAGKSKSAEESLSYGLQLAEDAVSTFTNGKTKQLSTHLVNIAKVGVRSLKSDEKPCELLKESLDILHGGLECVCPEDSKKFLTFGVKTMNMALSAGKSKSAEESLSYGLQLAEDAVSTFTNGKTKQLSTHLVNIAKVGVRSLKSNEKPSELLKESLDILHGGLECVCPEDSKKFLTFGVKTMNMALSAGKSKSAEESLSYGLQLAEDAVSTFTNGKTKQLSTHLVNIAKVGVRSLKSDEKPCELLKESLDILHGGLECVCPEDSKKFLTFGVKTMNMALSAGKSKSAEESLSYGLQLAEDAVSTFTNGKTKQLSTHLVNIAKVGVRSLKSNEKPSELLKESLDILHGGLECVCPEDSKKFLTFGVKTMNMALSAGKSKSAEESLSYGLQLAEDAVSTFTNGKTKQLSTHLVNIAKVGVRSLKSDEKPCELLKESLDILHGGLECVCPEDSKKFLTFGVKTMNMALSAGKSKSAEESLSYGLQLAEDAVSTFTNGKTKQLSTHLVNIAKVGVRSLKSNEKPSELLKESLDILHGGLECVCPEDSKKFLTFGVKTMNMALSAGKSKSAEESLSYGLQLAEDAVSTFTNVKTKQLSTHLVNIAKVGVRSLKSNEKPSELLKESLDILHGGLECVCPEDSKKFLTFGVKTMNMALSAGKSKSAEESLSYGLQLAEDAVSTFTNGKTKQLSTHLVNIAKVGVRSLKSDEKPCELLKESLDILHGGLECVCPEDSKKFLTFGVKTMNMALSAGNSKSAEESLSYGLQLAEDAVSTFTNGKTKQLSTHLVNIAKVGVRSLKLNEKPSELLKESLDILRGELECEFSDDSYKMFTFGVKTMNIGLLFSKNHNAAEALSYGLQLAEDVVISFSDNKPKHLRIALVNIAKICVQKFKSDRKADELLQECLNIIQNEYDCSPHEYAKKIFAFGVKSMNVALLVSNWKNVKETISYGLQLAEGVFNMLNESDSKNLKKFLMQMVKASIGTRLCDRNPSQLLKESLNILQIGLDGFCTEVFLTDSETSRIHHSASKKGNFDELLKDASSLEIYTDKTNVNLEEVTKNCRSCMIKTRRHHLVFVKKSYVVETKNVSVRALISKFDGQC